MEDDFVRNKEIEQSLVEMPDEELAELKFSMPWQYDSSDVTKRYRDSDGFIESLFGGKEDTATTRSEIQTLCWSKFHMSPYVNTAIRGLMGRLTGFGFRSTSSNYEIQLEIERTEQDWRNRLYTFWPKYVARRYIEGELFISTTIHEDGFVEIDFIDPAAITQGGDDDSGIIFHPTKTTMPLYYNIDIGGSLAMQVPSIYLAKFPDLRRAVDGGISKHPSFDTKLQAGIRSGKKIYKSLGGYTTFMMSWDAGLITKRAASYMRTILVWLNHYENLKKYEIDHKKSSGAYLWIFKIENPRDFKTWMALSDVDRKKTGITTVKTPGSSLVLPPGMTVECVNPNLTSIRDEDTDIKELVGAGLNEPEDVMTGSSKGTFASVKSSRGPMSDRTSDEVAYFERFLKYDFWAVVFFLKAAVGKFKPFFEVNEAIDFDSKQEPIFKKIKRRPEELIDIEFPVSETISFEERARAFLGVKHGPISETLGIPNSTVAKRIGVSGYGRARLEKATEDEKYPKLVYEMGVDTEAVQEKAEGEPKKTVKPKKPTTVKKN